MKKFWTVLLIGVLLCSCLVGCSKTDKDTTRYYLNDVEVIGGEHVNFNSPTLNKEIKDKINFFGKTIKIENNEITFSNKFQDVLGSIKYKKNNLGELTFTNKEVEVIQNPVLSGNTFMFSVGISNGSVRFTYKNSLPKNIKGTDGNIDDEISEPTEDFDEFEDDNYIYYHYLVSKKYEIYKFKNLEDSQKITIPNSVKGEPVFSIGDGAFKGATEIYGDLIVPNSIEHIGEKAFYECGKINNIYIPDSVIEIENNAFETSVSDDENGTNSKVIIYCRAIEKPEKWELWNSNNYSVEWGYQNTINSGDFVYDLFNNNVCKIKKYNGNVKNLILEESIDYKNQNYKLTEIEDFVFEDKDIETINLKNVSKIGKNTFYNCNKLLNIDFKNIIEIGKKAFFNCSNLTKISMPKTVKKIETEAFAECPNLCIYCECLGKQNYWMDNWNGKAKVEYGIINDVIVNNIQYKILSNKTAKVFGVIENAEVLNIEEKVNYLDKEYKVVGIFDKAFRDNKFVKEISLPKSITVINDELFYACTKLEKINLNNIKQIGNSAFINCLSLKSVNIPNNVEGIGEKAFKGCTDLKEVYIPNSVKSIGSYAFSCIAKLNIYCEATQIQPNWDKNWIGSNTIYNINWAYNM